MICRRAEAFRVPGLGHRDSGSGVLVREQVSGDASGRANHPWLAAAEQGCSALPKAEASTQRETGNRIGGCGRSIFGSQVSAISYLVQVFRFGCGCREMYLLTANRQPLAATTLVSHSKLNSPSVASVGGVSPARMVRTKRSRCSAQGPWARRASTCSGVP